MRDGVLDKFKSSWSSKEKNLAFNEYKKKIKTVYEEKEHIVFQLNEEISEA